MPDDIRMTTIISTVIDVNSLPKNRLQQVHYCFTRRQKTPLGPLTAIVGTKCRRPTQLQHESTDCHRFALGCLSRRPSCLLYPHSYHHHLQQIVTATALYALLVRARHFALGLRLKVLRPRRLPLQLTMSTGPTIAKLYDLHHRHFPPGDSALL